MRTRDRRLATSLSEGLSRFESERDALPGIRRAAARQALLEQLVESIRRVKYVQAMRERQISDRRGDPSDALFDPLLSAILHQRRGELEEAFWLVFLFVHFGKHRRGGWRYVREVYGRLGDGQLWDWPSTSADPAAFRTWLGGHVAELKRSGVAGGFGNHRKYQSLDADSASGTGAAIASYVQWVNPPRTHQGLVLEEVQNANGDRKDAFNRLYKSMAAVASFGRTARFDYLCMLGKLELAPIEPGSAYIEGSTGPKAGTILLLGGIRSRAELDGRLVGLDAYLRVGMQVLEDALCNWQKSPNNFRRFRL